MQVQVPATSELRERLSLGASSTYLVVNENRGQPYKTDTLGVRRLAAKHRPSLATLQYRDLRRTGVVWMAEEGATIPHVGAVTGRSFKTVNDISEAYLPRTHAPAATGIAHLEARRERHRLNKPDGAK